MTTAERVVIDVDGLRMTYGTAEVLKDVTFRVRHGEVVCLLGPNGAGKTTTLEILEGFRTRSAGRVEVLGTDPAHADEPWRARVGVVLQSWRDHGRWRVRELLAHLALYYPRPWDTDELVAAVGLTAQADKKVRMLSGGQRRRLDVAVGIVGHPELLFLDEPTAGLDPVARREFHDLVARLADEQDTTIVLTTHDLHEAQKLANRIMILKGGRIIADGTAQELAERIVGEDEVRWSRDGLQYHRTTSDSTKLAFDLFRQYGESVTDLEIRKATLEDTYLSLVRQQADAGGAETGAAAPADETGEPAR
ncbi:ABC transporter ATP-binding protein [Streptomyces katrae]|uniref:ABC transporter ATP-binding protein n=1 Tax=Streptomyces katrae TaxID=68223 RepID=A0ABT7H4R5_9ACTN|nr:ABC transporter ATP-binding protein [Streptomyces katrae]MDK9500868.1 ABC transporter ATP-binding protein [Streptomyces katrae]